jgi:hypothetical protein
MRTKFINQLVYIALITVVLLSFGCFETDQITEVLTQVPQDTAVMTPEPDPLDPGEGLAVGATAPTFSLPDADGNLVSLSDYAGQMIVIQFYSTGT